MADRNVKVSVRADVSDFKRGMADAERSADRLASSTSKAAEKSKSGLSGLAQSARDNSQAWQTVGGALTVYGTAVAGLATLVGKVGIEYNTLRQRSGAALTTLTGSAEEANAQMDKLDAFATTSPFARDVFIKAQQQMFGFGIEAQKVIPYLDAIQNAVAAAGGSNNDISELSRIFSQISASAKITATDLREFGNRGIDAATIIGSQMGKTGAQIREEITDGTLDAGAALDALAAGMQDRFGGAADNVKNTFLGAVDRVKAAFRDLSSSLMTPLVDPEGGGAVGRSGSAGAVARIHCAAGSPRAPVRDGAPAPARGDHRLERRDRRAVRAGVGGGARPRGRPPASTAPSGGRAGVHPHHRIAVGPAFRSR